MDAQSNQADGDLLKPIKELLKSQYEKDLESQRLLELAAEKSLKSSHSIQHNDIDSLVNTGNKCN